MSAVPTASAVFLLPANRIAITRLTALWGLAEAGLGGVLFALKIPLTGFLIGAVSTMLLSLIARFSQYSYRQIISSTVTVLLIKAAVSPHAPPPAYLAVAFQGLLAALLFSTLRQSRIAPVLLGAISMAESALQKIIVLTLLFGKSIWEAVNTLGKEITRTFGFPADHNYALGIIGGYLLLYTVWGVFVGIFATRLPARIEAQKEVILDAYFRKPESAHPAIPLSRKKGRRKTQMLFYAVILIFIALVFWISGVGSSRLAAIMLRSVAAIALLFLVVRPFLQWVLARWLRSRSNVSQKHSAEVLALLPTLRSYLPAAYAAAKTQRGPLARISYFLTTMIILSLYAGNNTEDVSV